VTANAEVTQNGVTYAIPTIQALLILEASLVIAFRVSLVVSTYT
jgi:hypothetical protein